MKTLSGLAVGALLIFTAQAQASQKIISFNGAYRGGVMAQSVEGLGGKVVKQFSLINALVAVFPDSLKDARLRSLSGVVRVEEDRYVHWLEVQPPTVDSIRLPSVEEALTLVRSDSDREAPHAVEIIPPVDQKEVQWGARRLNAPAAWERTEGDGVKVAVIDTGVDFNHPDLKPNYAGGFNAVHPDSAPWDDQGHGTHVAGIIAAARDSSGVVGVAPKVSLYAVKVLDANGSGEYSTIISGIEWAILNKMDVVNMSFGSRDAIEAMKEIVAVADKARVTLVCAAGNNGGAVLYPAKYPETLAIAASDQSNGIAYFSSRGPEIDFIAPGAAIYSTTRFGNYDLKSGTSMAAPHMAGLAALAIAMGAQTPAEVRKALVAAATPLPELTSDEQGAGQIDAAKLAP